MSHNPPYGPPPPYYSYTVPGAHPPQPAPGTYTYVQTPVMMPVYQPQPAPVYQPQPPPPPQPEPVQPTYVTNYVYQQPPQPQPVIVKEITIQSHQSSPLDNVKTIAEKRLAKGLAWLGNSLQSLNSKSFDWVPATTSDFTALTHRAFVAGREGWDHSQLWVIRAHHGGEFIPGKLAVKHRAAYVPHGGKEVPVHSFEVLCAPSHAVRWLPSSNGQVPAGAIPAGNTHTAEPLYIGRAKHSTTLTPGKVHPSHGCCYISYGGSEISYKTYEVLCRIVG